ncbi:MAG: type II toxin-antitoxin system RelE/ParE family toxin [Candidatus Lokiarchaeota archaeon]|nr:type II toxin-antitoxin system RelE/ParE family toxin [Candidatus Lokiarchaeota archaeon]
MVSIEWTKDAEFDFDQILAYLSNASSQYASNFFEKVFDSVLNLERFPKMGRKVPESTNEEDREIIIQSYRLIYQYVEQEDKIYIKIIIHGSRNLKL